MVTIHVPRRPRHRHRVGQAVAADDLPSVPYPARVIVVDEHDLPRAGMRGLLAGLAEIEVVTEANDGHQTAALCRRLRPDLVLMELQLPGLDGASATQQIRADCPETRVVILTLRDDPASLR